MSNDILVVDDDPGAVQLMGRILMKLAPLRFATNGADAMRLMHESRPDLVLLDAEMPGISGFKLFDALRAEPDLADIPVVFVTSHSEQPFEVSALEMGAVDFISKPVRAQLVLARVKMHLRMKRMADELRRTATIDALTGLGTRRHFDELLEREWQRAHRHGNPLSLLLVDVDHFKLYNDHYGHQKGDVCLREVALALKTTVHRTADFIARCGGEEFGLLLPQTTRDGAERVAQRVLDAVESLGLRHDASATARHVTVSVGVSCYDEDSACFAHPATNARFRDGLSTRYTESELVLAADKALYAAKRAGRARARVLDIASTEPPEPIAELEPRRPVTRLHASV